MTTLFKRDWQLVVDDLDISGLEFNFKAEKNIKSQPNKLDLRVYNLTADHVAQITKRAKAKSSTGVRVDVSAGYINNVQLVFRGDAREISTSHEGPDCITTIAAHDGGRAYRESRISQSFAPGASPQALILACANALNIGSGNATDSSVGASLSALGNQYPNGVVMSGKASDQLTRITRACGMTWSVQNGVLQLQKAGQPLQTESVRIAADSGMIGSPSVDMDSSVASNSTKQKKPTLVNVKCLMIPGLYPGRKILLQAAGYDGGYQIVETVYSGDTSGNDWYAMLKVRPY